MDLVTAAFIFAVSNMELPARCGYIAMPKAECRNVQRAFGSRARGAYLPGHDTVWLDRSVCKNSGDMDENFLVHEIGHYLQSKCGLSQSEAVPEALQMTYDGA